MPATVFVLDAVNLVGWQAPDTVTLTGEEGLLDFLDASQLNSLLDAWAALQGVKL